MNRDLSPEAAEYGHQATRALEAAGGDELVRQAGADPTASAAVVERVLRDLGAWELQPRLEAQELEAAAALCRAVGWCGAPYPVAERLSRPTDLEGDGLVVIAGPRPAAAVAGVDLRWTAVSLDGARSIARPRAGAVAGVGSLLVTPLALEPLDDSGGEDVALALVLPCWTLLGMLDRAVDLTRRYVVERHQFGQALAAFQGVQFQLTEAEVERAGVDELARYALWSAQAGRPEAVDDALALRLAALEAAEVVFRVTHQLHGAVGFCDETLLSWLSRASQPLRRLPTGRSATADALTRRIDGRGLVGLFG